MAARAICTLSGVALLAACCGAWPVAAAAQTASPFVAVGGGVWNWPVEVVPEVFQVDASGPLLLEFGSLPTAYGKYRAQFGSNGHEVQVPGGNGLEVAGGSVWSDGFFIGGGSGSGVLQLSTRITGSVAGRYDMAFALYTSDQPFDWQEVFDTVDESEGIWDWQLPGVQRWLFTGIVNGCGGQYQPDDCTHYPHVNFQGSFDETLWSPVPFTYGQTLYVLSVFSGETGRDAGSGAFFNSASFGISPPAGATLRALSETAYASAVPEPATALLLLTGLCGWAVARRAAPR